MLTGEKGSDTSRVALTATIFHCVHNPTTLDLLKTEVRGAFQTPDDICVGQRLSSCQYLRACIDEAMRLSPSIGSINPRQPLAGGIAVDGHFFPEGTDLGTPIYAIHHQERYYPNAFAFKPARWIVDESISGSEDEVALAHSAFAPFMIGPRACVGKVLAYTEIMILLARIVFSFDLRLSADSSEGIPSWAKGRSNKEDFHIFDSVIALHDGPMVEFKPREFSAC